MQSTIRQAQRRASSFSAVRLHDPRAVPANSGPVTGNRPVDAPPEVFAAPAWMAGARSASR